MASDRIVTPAHILRAIRELERRRPRRVLSELEKLEPDLAEHLLENLTELYHLLLRLGLSGKEARRAHRAAESTAMVCIMALRDAHRELWLPDEGDKMQGDQEADPGPCI